MSPCTIGRAVGAGYLRAVLGNDDAALEQYEATYGAEELLRRVAEQAATLLLHVANHRHQSPGKVCDDLVSAAVLRDKLREAEL